MKIKKIIFLFAIAFFVSSCDIETKQMNEHLLNIYSETQLADLPRYDWRVRHFFEMMNLNIILLTIKNETQVLSLSSNIIRLWINIK